MISKRLTTWTLFIAAILISLSTAYAAPLVIDPATGEDAVAIDRRFFWEGGLGAIDSIGTPGGGGIGTYDPIWSVTVPGPRIMDTVAIDGFTPGDVFELVFDNVITPWDNSFFDGSGYFHGEYAAHLTGAHTFSLNVTAGLPLGGSWFSFSAARPEVPEPATMLLLGTGLAGIAGAARRRKKNQA